ncbi:hypothetical protein COU76_03930 [Candidatus Peregrinibacteria bacterium CG10_big_fil_rev_8_21_14_0_10_49_10]|nr:MAG: hypothetical protein COU76_03930 [Candidatus Peregrinibacteria bacterium CG10_big_fil_rev_8_21_14_0_10_49_10]
MMSFLRYRAPELGLLLLGGFFCLRELGTFPAAWTDDSLFMIVARQVAEGRGYTVPLLHSTWMYPYILAVGPTLILPVALFIKLFGFSVAVARVPMVLYILLTTVALYLFTQKMADRNSARWATALLISLSTFINTGKTVMGEIPGFFFLLLGLLLLLQKERLYKRDVCIGICFGLSVLTKLTYGLVYPALGIAWITALCRREKREVLSLTIMGVLAVLVFLPWRLLEMSSVTGLSRDFAFMFRSDDGSVLQILHGNIGLLLRPQYLYYGAMLFLGCMGLWVQRHRLSLSAWIIISALIVSCTVYFLSSFGWYRHLLPAHLLLIPFVVIALRSLPAKKVATGLLLFFLAGQTYWQWDHQGSSASTAAANAAMYVEQNMQETDLIIQIAPVFVRLDHNPHWLFLTNPTLTSRLPGQFVSLTEKERCFGWIRGTEATDAENTQLIGGKFAVIPPPDDCP